MRALLHKILNKILFKFAEYYKPIDMRVYYCHGDRLRLHLGRNVSATNTIFNLASGQIHIGDNTIFGHNCMALTGRHEFVGGRRKKLVTGESEAPSEGFDIVIGAGCWIASGAIITGGVTIGDNVIIGAGSVVTKNIPSGTFAAGVPAKVIRKFDVGKNEAIATNPNATITT